jgi:5'-3' exonuclease
LPLLKSEQQQIAPLTKLEQNLNNPALNQPQDEVDDIVSVKTTKDGGR